MNGLVKNYWKVCAWPISNQSRSPTNSQTIATYAHIQVESCNGKEHLTNFRIWGYCALSNFCDRLGWWAGIGGRLVAQIANLSNFCLDLDQALVCEIEPTLVWSITLTWWNRKGFGPRPLQGRNCAFLADFNFEWFFFFKYSCVGPKNIWSTNSCRFR